METTSPGSGDHTSVATKKRKREPSTSSNHLATPAASVTSPAVAPEMAEEHWVRFGPTIPIYKNYSDSMKLFQDDLSKSTLGLPQYVGDDREFIHVAQLLADQVVLQNNFFAEKISLHDRLAGINEVHMLDGFMEELLAIINRIFPDSTKCDLKMFLENSVDTFQIGKNNPTPLKEDPERRKPASLNMRGFQPKDETIFKNPNPFASVRRGDNTIDIGAAALHFWEDLGLAPAHKSKDVTACCLYPDDETVRTAVSSFLHAIESSYQGCKLGSHRRWRAGPGQHDGFVPMAVLDPDAGEVFKQISRACLNFGQHLQGALQTNECQLT